tara:strand:+ start:1120 stop:1584 length:465 start_codon:yes stop_codon:yes gene_type:complete
MSLTTALAIAGTVSSFFGGGGGGSNPFGDSGGMDIGGTSNTALGFLTKAAKTYNTVRRDKDGNNPFQQSASIKTPKSYREMFPAKTPATTPTAGTAYSGPENPDLQTAILNLVNNAQNQQMQQVIEEQRVAATIQQGRKNIGTEQPTLSSINVV